MNGGLGARLTQTQRAADAVTQAQRAAAQRTAAAWSVLMHAAQKHAGQTGEAAATQAQRAADGEAQPPHHGQLVEALRSLPGLDREPARLKTGEDIRWALERVIPEIDRNQILRGVSAGPIDAPAANEVAQRITRWQEDAAASTVATNELIEQCRDNPCFGSWATALVPTESYRETRANLHAIRTGCRESLFGHLPPRATPTEATAAQTFATARAMQDDLRALGGPIVLTDTGPGHAPASHATPSTGALVADTGAVLIGADGTVHVTHVHIAQPRMSVTALLAAADRRLRPSSARSMRPPPKLVGSSNLLTPSAPIALRGIKATLASRRSGTAHVTRNYEPVTCTPYTELLNDPDIAALVKVAKGGDLDSAKNARAQLPREISKFITGRGARTFRDLTHWLEPAEPAVTVFQNAGRLTVRDANVTAIGYNNKLKERRQHKVKRAVITN